MVQLSTPGVTPNRGMPPPREALFVKLLWPLVVVVFLLCCVFSFCVLRHISYGPLARNTVEWNWMLIAHFEIKGGVRRTNDSQCIYDFYSSDRSKTGRFFSPQYPQHYPPHANCQFFFYALPHEKVKVTFDSVELEVTSGRSASKLRHLLTL